MLALSGCGRKSRHSFRSVETRVDALTRVYVAHRLLVQVMMLCSEIMKRHVQTATIDMSAQQAARLMSEHQIGFLPVCDVDHRPVGVVTYRDLALRVCAENLRAGSTFLGAIMTHDPLSCREHSSVESAEELMLQRKSRRILLLDGHGRLVGLISLADVVHHQDPFKIAHFVRTLTESRLRVEK